MVVSRVRFHLERRHRRRRARRAGRVRARRRGFPPPPSSPRLQNILLGVGSRIADRRATRTDRGAVAAAAADETAGAIGLDDGDASAAAPSRPRDVVAFAVADETAGANARRGGFGIRGGRPPVRHGGRGDARV